MTLTGTSRRGAIAREHEPPPGLLGRIGLAASGHFRLVVLLWLVVIAGLGALAPKATSVLAGAGWQAQGSQSVQVRDLVDQHFGGTGSTAVQVVVHAERPVSDPQVRAVLAHATSLLQANPAVAEVVQPQPGATISQDGHTEVLLAGAKADANGMVQAADALKGPLHALSGHGITVEATGSSVLWSDFNAANHAAMMHSEIMSWPVTMIILVLAFGSLVAAGLPLLLTISGLAASAGALVLLDHLTPTSIWAMNFAMMFALALGIDYALFLVVRFRAALARHHDAHWAVGETMDTAGKAVALSGATVLVSLSAVMLVPVPAFRSMAAGIMIAVAFILAATLTLLPAVLGRLGARVDKGRLPWVRAVRQEQDEAGGSEIFAGWGARLWRNPLRYGLPALVILLALASPLLGLRTAMPSITVVPPDSSSRAGYVAAQQAFGPGMPGTMQIVAPTSEAPAAITAAEHTAGIAAVTPAQPAPDGSGLSLIQAVPKVDPSNPALGATVDQLRAHLPAHAMVGGAAVENLDLQSALSAKTPLVIAVVMSLGFLLLLAALRAPLAALAGTLASLLSTGAAFGVARLIFQGGHGASLLGFTPQGFLDGWAPVFFFAMIFAIAMDYTVFLLASAKEHFELTGDPKAAVIGALRHSGRVVFAAAAVMVAVFFTFSLSGPLPPKEMGVILGVAVFLDAALIRLVLLPVLLRLLGREAWACPRWLARILPNIHFAH